MSLSLIDLMVLLGIAVILPLAIGGPTAGWLLAAGSAFVAFQLREGWAGICVLPFGAVAAAVLVGRLRAGNRWRTWRAWGIDDGVELLAPAYALVAAGSLFASRCGLELFGIYEPIVELTAVHYTYAGVAALVLAEAARAGRGQSPLALAAVGCTALAPPIVAVGFTTHAGIPQVGGAVLMTIGVWCTGLLELGGARTLERPAARVLLTVSGLAIWAPMVLAVAWAAGEHWDVPALSIPDMARTHGVTNALGFSLCGLLARRLEAPA